jgi:uncharacterized protein YndB with AHSA1/START domain
MEDPMTTRHRRAASAVQIVRAAAAVEAAALGDGELREEHVLLGLSAVGGPTAHVLAARGAGLAELRSVVWQSRQRDDLSAAEPLGPGRVRAANMRLWADTGAASGLHELLVAAGAQQGDDRRILLELLAQPGRSEAREALLRLGIDGDELRTQLESDDPQEPDAEPSAGCPPIMLPSPDRGRFVRASHTHVLPTRPDDVWALLSTPDRRPEWDGDCVSLHVRSDGELHRVRHDGRTDRHVVTIDTADRAVEWRWPARDGVPDDRRLNVLQLCVSTAGPWTTLRLTRVMLARTAAVVVAGGLLKRIMRNNLRIVAVGINQASAIECRG